MSASRVEGLSEGALAFAATVLEVASSSLWLATRDPRRTLPRLSSATS
ncbi:MAG: hypothetical protein ACRDZO_12340 [Egibacteraceae bacterium]